MTDGYSIGLHFEEVELSRAIVSGSVFKYVTADVAFRFLDSWHLKYGGYNDAFEMRPVFSLDAWFARLPEFAMEFKRASADEQQHMTEALRDGMEDGARKSLGALCLSRAGESLTMWGHYGDGFRGVRLEFDASNPAFGRGHPTQGAGYGRLFPVVYPKTRDDLVADPFDVYSTLEQTCLTKAPAWSYEEECRLLWPLSDPDRSVIAAGVKHLLYFVGPSALRSVVFGVDSLRETEGQSRALLAKCAEASHVLLYRAHRQARDFGFTYEPLPR